MLMSTISGPDGRWHRARVLLRLAGLAAVLFGVVEIPPGVGLHGRGLAVAISTSMASLGWLAMISPPQRRPVMLAALAVQVVSGGIVTGLTPGGPAVALPAVGVFDAVVLLAPAAAAGLTAVGVAAMAAAALTAGGTWGPTIASYTFGLAAALLLGFNRRQYLARAEQADQLLAQAQRARDEQARAAALDERTRLAREIHDLLAHSLGALAVQLDVTEALLADGAEPARVQTHVHRARALAVDGLSEARRAVAALRGDTPPLPRLLDGLLEEYWAESGAPARLQVLGTERALAADAALAVVRTAQEAISNVRKHAPGAAITLRLAYQGEATVLTITDCPPDAGTTPPPATTALSATGAGYGLTGLRERAELLGGTLHAGPDGSSGWTIELRLPEQP
jgi:signal transduction histidine kinase